MPASNAQLDDMPAENSPKNKIQKLGILAGGGQIPVLLARSCDEQGIKTFIIGFDGHVDYDAISGLDHRIVRLGAVGTTISTLKKQEIKDLVLVGSIKRPGVMDLRPDLKGAAFLAKHSMTALGDDGLLRAIKSFLEEEGFEIHGPQRFMTSLLTPEGALGAVKPAKQEKADILKGIEVVRALGQLDVGQSVIVQDGVVLGVEAAEGTDGLIRRCKDLKKTGSRGILVKMCKPQQDKDLDLPTIGIKTLEQAVDCDLSGIAIHAGASLMIDKRAMITFADSHDLFLYGFEDSSQS